jgi:hypothetical protein
VLAKIYNGTGKTWADGDFNRDGTVNFTDLLILAKAYTKALPPPVARSTSYSQVGPEGADPRALMEVAFARDIPAPHAVPRTGRR